MRWWLINTLEVTSRGRMCTCFRDKIWIVSGLSDFTIGWFPQLWSSTIFLNEMRSKTIPSGRLQAVLFPSFTFFFCLRFRTQTLCLRYPGLCQELGSTLDTVSSDDGNRLAPLTLLMTNDGPRTRAVEMEPSWLAVAAGCCSKTLGCNWESASATQPVLSACSCGTYGYMCAS